MKRRFVIFSLILLMLIISTAYADSGSSGSTSSTTSSSSSSSTTSSSSTIDQAALVYVSNATLDTAQYFPGDEGTLTVTLTNAGTSAIGLEDPTILTPHLIVQPNDWEGMSFVGAGSTITYSILFTVKPPCGTYNALFTVGAQNGNAINYPVMIQISPNTLTGAITSQPTSFAPEAEQNVTLTLMNTGNGNINNVVITPEGSGIDADPAMELVSTISAGSSSAVTFGITPHQASDLTFNVSYQNGDNTHFTDVVLPITMGQDKTAAVPVLNDVALTTTGSDYDITGDITNAGITDAYGVIVNVGSPATGTGTYPVYAIGSIASDDSGTFELTFTTSDLSAVPVVISWKDADGNDFSVTKTLDLASSSTSTSENSTAGSGSKPSTGSTMGGAGSGGMNRGGYGGRSSSSSLFGGITSGRGGGISAFYPLIAGSVIIVIGIVLWTKRKWISLKLKKQQ